MLIVSSVRSGCVASILAIGLCLPGVALADASEGQALAVSLDRYIFWLIMALLALLVVFCAACYFLALSRRLNRAQQQLLDEIRSRRAVEEILHRLALHTTTTQDEDTFLKNCVQDLAQFYKTRYAFIGLFADQEKRSIITRAVWAGNTDAENFEYSLAGTPCEDVLNDDIEIIPRNAAKLYPDDKMLTDMGIDSYYGAPLVAHSGEVLGLVTVMDDKPMKPATWARDVLGVFANRIAVELERLNIERELTSAAKELSYLASHDSLTGLINRREFERRLANALDEARNDNRRHAFCYMDLDQFKIVNDSCGHAAGDELLRQLTMELEKHIRASDTLARLGGDEFGLLLLDCPMQRALEIAEGLRDSINQFRFSWDGRRFDIGVSIGLASIDQYSGALKNILNAADAACYIAKEQGRNRTHVFQDDDVVRLKRSGEMQWVARINAALHENHFLLYRQNISPTVKPDGEREQFEILLRYADGAGEVILPGDLISAAERYSQMLSVDKWVIQNTLYYLSDDFDPHLLREKDLLLCHVNISGLSMLDDDFQHYIESMLQKTGVPPHALCLEITETAAISNLARATRFIHVLRALGVRFALDDFGSGMSSFTYLKNLPVDFLKIDGHFVRDVTRDAVHRTMLKSIHKIGNVMQIKTIAESVESKSICEILAKIGVDYVQGNAIDLPRPIRNVAGLTPFTQK